MTLEEATELLRYRRNLISSVDMDWCANETEALDLALSALRPVSREQVEKAWRGCEKCNGAGEYSRYAENLTKILLAKYCPHCGRPLTDEAEEMVMERINKMEETGDGLG